MADRTCSSPCYPPCPRPLWANGLCNSHLARLRKGQDISTPIRDRIRTPICKAEDCGRPGVGRDFCDVHYKRDLKGEPLDKPIRRRGGAECGYGAAHTRVAKARGRASDYTCADCPAMADQWSYNHSGIKELEDIDHGRTVTYSMDIWQYDPRCHFCHNHFDHDY